MIPLKMKKKLITKLMQLPDLMDAEGELLRVIPDQDGGATTGARIVLAAALLASRQQGVTDPAQFHKGLCSATAGQLRDAFEGTPAASFSLEQIAAAQLVLQEILTSKAGRPTSATPEDRAAQVKEAQARRRQKLTDEENRRRLSEWISAEAAQYLADVQRGRGCKSKGEALEMVLQKAIELNLLVQTKARDT